MQQVNLFSPEFVPSPARLGLRTVALSGLAMIGLIFFIAVFQFQRLQDTRSTTQQLTERNQQIMTAITQTQGDRQAQLTAAERKKGLQVQLELQQQLLADLEKRASLDTKGYSPLLEALARVPMKQSWLTEISVQGQQIRLTGETTNAKQIPDWIEALQQSTYLQQKRFAYLQIKPVDNKPGVLAFELGDLTDGVTEHEPQ